MSEAALMDGLIRAARMYATANLAAAVCSRKHHKMPEWGKDERCQHWEQAFARGMGDFVGGVELTREGEAVALVIEEGGSDE
jgi:hypothetical protein